MTVCEASLARMCTCVACLLPPVTSPARGWLSLPALNACSERESVCVCERGERDIENKRVFIFGSSGTLVFESSEETRSQFPHILFHFFPSLGNRSLAPSTRQQL